MKIIGKTPIKPAFDLNKSYVGPRVGIELEYEGVVASVINAEALGKYWHTEIDHSLRTGGLEFISKPLKKSQLEDALITVKAELVKSGAHISKRCGVHVHLNVSDLTFNEVWKVLTLYTAAEPYVFKHFADGREDSHFCVPVWANTAFQSHCWEDASRLYRGMQKRTRSNMFMLQVPGPQGHMLRTYVPLKMLGNPKYSAVNVQSLQKFGTLEFRHLYGTTDMRKVDRWCRFLLRLREKALIQYENAEEIASTLVNEGYAAILPPIGLEERPDVNPEYVEDAIDAVCTIVGHPPTDPNVFEWEIS
jgi:hypothetical protein